MSQIFSSCSHLIPTGPTGLYLSKIHFIMKTQLSKNFHSAAKWPCSYMHLAYMYWRTSWTWNQPALAQPAKNFVRPTSARVQNDRQFVWLVPLGIEHLWELSRVFTCVICVMWESRHRTDRRAHCRAKTAPWYSHEMPDESDDSSPTTSFGSSWTSIVRSTYVHGCRSSSVFINSY